jgi:YidC/Oxa1 family membrane protein insertase
MLAFANIFQPLIDVFDTVLKFFHNSLGIQWGWAIVLLTIVIRALMIPLTVRQFHSMQALQRHQPELKAIQSKYKDDKQRQQQELMKFYRENNVNPLGSCLPLALQLPVFISLFYMLRNELRINICPQVQHQAMTAAAALAHPPHPLPGSPGSYVPCGPNGGANFLFIPDLTNNAHGWVLILLLVLYVGSQLASSLVMQSPTMDKTQRRIMLFMPLIFVFIVIRFPAGVLVYWITTNCWTIAQQLIVKRRIGAPTTPAVAGATAGSAAAAVGSSAPNGASADGSGGERSGLGSLLKVGGRGDSSKADAAVRDGAKQDKPTRGAPTRAGTQTTPPPPPRKKKKRSGRRR